MENRGGDTINVARPLHYNWFKPRAFHAGFGLQWTGRLDFRAKRACHRLLPQCTNQNSSPILKSTPIIAIYSGKLQLPRARIFFQIFFLHCISTALAVDPDLARNPGRFRKKNKNKDSTSQPHMSHWAHASTSIDVCMLYVVKHRNQKPDQTRQTMPEQESPLHLLHLLLSTPLQFSFLMLLKRVTKGNKKHVFFSLLSFNCSLPLGIWCSVVTSQTSGATEVTSQPR